MADRKVLELTSEIVASYVSNHRLAPDELPGLVRAIHNSLTAPSNSSEANAGAAQRPTAAQIRRSIRDDEIISFLDGRGYKQLKRHLTSHGLSAEEYRERFGLPATYPMVAPSYSARRSELARASGLGTKTRRSKGKGR